jgi:superfamily I DNA/RNA helicase
MINKFPGNCADCGKRVEAGAGEAFRADGRWFVRHDGCSAPAQPVDAGEATAAVITLARSQSAPAASQSDQYTLLSGHPASPYQAAVFEHFRNGRGSVIVDAGAGSGKTTTLKNALLYLDPRLSVQLFAFGHDPAAELQAALDELTEKFPERSFRNVRAGTFHSVCMRAVARHLALPKAQMVVESNKCAKILRTRLCVTPEGEETHRLYSAFACALVAFAKGEGIGCLVPDTEERWWALVEHHGMYLDSTEAEPARGVEIARQLLRWSNEEAARGWLDFDDQIYCVILWKLRLWQNDVVCVDEAQDTNAVRRAVARLALRPGGRLYAVGDEKQAIFGFTGASVDALDLVAEEFGCRRLPLTVSYRCARAVVERAQTWMPRLEPAPGASEGEVLDDVALKDVLAQLTPDDAILCRQTAPLVSVAYGLIARGRPCRILGKEIGEGLVNLVEQQKARGIDRLVEKLEAWREREMARFTAKGDERRAEGVGDRVDCLLVIVAALPETERTIPALVARIRGMFSDDKTARILTLATVHKVKGLEYPTVAILRPELSPSRAARLDWQYEQELNLMGVAATRAKTCLIYVRDEDMEIGK